MCVLHMAFCRLLFPLTEVLCELTAPRGHHSLLCPLCTDIKLFIELKLLAAAGSSFLVLKTEHFGTILVGGKWRLAPRMEMAAVLFALSFASVVAPAWAGTGRLRRCASVASRAMAGRAPQLLPGGSAGTCQMPQCPSHPHTLSGLGSVSRTVASTSSSLLLCKLRSVMLDRAENLLHDHYGGKEYWDVSVALSALLCSPPALRHFHCSLAD